jgi:tRNA nucleotidyltransferase (CCA-adding enzyme)
MSDHFLGILDYLPPSYYPELLALQDVPQDASHHPEGDAYIHTYYVTEAAEEIADREDLSMLDTLILVFAAITHDFGKATTTVVHEDGRITAYGHPEAGVEPAKAFLERMTVNETIKATVPPLVREHMAWIGFFMSEITDRAVRRLARRLMPATIEMWALLVEADMSGRPPKVGGLPDRAKQILDKARELGVNNGTQL